MHRSVLPSAFDVSSLTFLLLHAKICKALMETHTKLLDGTAPPPVASMTTAATAPLPLVHSALSEQSASPLKSTRIKQKCKENKAISLSGSPAVCYLSLGVHVISQHYMRQCWESPVSSGGSLQSHTLQGCGHSYRISYVVGKSLYQRHSPPCRMSGVISRLRAGNKTVATVCQGSASVRSA